MTILVSPQGALGEHCRSCIHLGLSNILSLHPFSDISKLTKTIALLGVLVVISRVIKLVQGIKVRCGMAQDSHQERKETER